MGNLMLSKKIAGGDFACPPTDTYLMTFLGHGPVEQKPSFNDPNKMVDRVRLDFRIDGYDGDDDDQAWLGETIRDWFTVSLHEKSKLLPFVVALRGGLEVEDDEEFDLDELVGKQIKATITAKENGYPGLSGAIAIRKKKKPTEQRELSRDENPMFEQPNF